MNDDRWIVIPNWDKFQHYRNRGPTWIKLYTELAYKAEWLELTMHQRGVLVSLWIEYAASACQLRANTASLSRRVGGRVSSVQLKALSDAGFIELSASKPLATRARARERDREETETEPPKSPIKKPRPAKVTGWRIVRGSHGVTHVPDPFGTDKPPNLVRPL